MIARCLFCCAAMLVLSVGAAGQARRPTPIGDETGRDAVGFRKDSVTKETLGDRRAPANSPTTKQAMEDFLEIQKANKRIQEMSVKSPMEFEEIAKSAKELRGRASRIKSSLLLPSPKTKAEVASSKELDELLTRIKELDEQVKAFVRNPLFRRQNDSTRDLPMEASVNLSRVIALSKVVEDGANKLR